jgi:hypothetical protein
MKSTPMHNNAPQNNILRDAADRIGPLVMNS